MTNIIRLFWGNYLIFACNNRSSVSHISRFLYWCFLSTLLAALSQTEPHRFAFPSPVLLHQGPCSNKHSSPRNIHSELSPVREMLFYKSVCSALRTVGASVRISRVSLVLFVLLSFTVSGVVLIHNVSCDAAS